MTSAQPSQALTRCDEARLDFAAAARAATTALLLAADASRRAAFEATLATNEARRAAAAAALVIAGGGRAAKARGDACFARGDAAGAAAAYTVRLQLTEADAHTDALEKVLSNRAAARAPVPGHMGLCSFPHCQFCGACPTRPPRVSGARRSAAAERPTGGLGTCDSTSPWRRSWMRMQP